VPGDRELLLARVGPERQQIYRLVRELVDQLDAAAPWDDLYFPPDGAAEFLAMLTRLIELVDGIPPRVRELVERLVFLALDDETRQTLEEAEFYFAGIHGMCTHDLERLRSLVAGHRAAPADAPVATTRNYLCEVAADLKGKYASALMGATASVVAEGLWTGVEVEPVLFPEKAEEGPRNEALVNALRRVLAAIEELPKQVAFPQLLERWRAGARVDPYALADLASFRGALGQVLKRGMRRALYSGDYHQIEWRERALSQRIAELEAAHQRTWGGTPESAEAAAATYQQLVRLALEIAALMDVDLLDSLVGGRAVKQLRTAASGGRSPRKPLAPELEPLVPLFASEDLQTFLELLLGAVFKRASFATARSQAAEAHRAEAAAVVAAAVAAAEAAAAEAAGAEATGAEAAAAPAPVESAAPQPPVAARLAAARPLPVPPSPAASGGAGPDGEAALLGAAAPETQLPRLVPRGASSAVEGTLTGPRETLERLDATLTSLLAPGNPDRSALRMLQRLLERHSRIPPSMVHSAHPFLYSVLNELVPELEAASVHGLVPQAARDRLVECCTALTDRWLTPQQMDTEVPAHFTRLQRLLEGLAAATTAQLKSAR
jgi:hypothetical protein